MRQATKIKKALLSFNGIDPSTEVDCVNGLGGLTDGCLFVQDKVVERLTKCSVKELKLICSIFKQHAPSSSADKDDVIGSSLIAFFKSPSGKKGAPPKRKAPPKKAKTPTPGSDHEEEEVRFVVSHCQYSIFYLTSLVWIP